MHQGVDQKSDARKAHNGQNGERQRLALIRRGWGSLFQLLTAHGDHISKLVDLNSVQNRIGLNREHPLVALERLSELLTSLVTHTLERDRGGQRWVIRHTALSNLTGLGNLPFIEKHEPLRDDSAKL